MLNPINLENKCGSCDHFRQIGDTAQGECLQSPYGELVAHDPKHPYRIVTRSRSNCRLYNAKPKTNADRIRAMSDEELAKCIYEIGFDCHLCSEHERLSDNPFLCNEKCDEKCVQHCLEWLKQPPKDGEV